MLTGATEVYRSPRLSDCEERAFVLTAVGLPSHVAFDGRDFVLEVEPDVASEARAHLTRYELESRPARPPPPGPQPYPFAWVGSAVYVLVVFAVTLAISNGMGRLDAFDLGVMDAGRVQQGEWWRAWTALTLHLDAAHLFANLGAGVWFGYLAGRQLGPGHAWFLTVAGAGAANLLEALLGPAAHRAVGASTAVFAALGLLAAYSWRERLHLPQRWARRWAPLIAGVALLGWTGSQGEGTDVVAHVIGFATGTALGAIAALGRVRRTLRRVPQWLTGLLAVGVVAAAWTAAQLS